MSMESRLPKVTDRCSGLEHRLRRPGVHRHGHGPTASSSTVSTDLRCSLVEPWRVHTVRSRSPASRPYGHRRRRRPRERGCIVFGGVDASFGFGKVSRIRCRADPLVADCGPRPCRTSPCHARLDGPGLPLISGDVFGPPQRGKTHRGERQFRCPCGRPVDTVRYRRLFTVEVRSNPERFPLEVASTELPLLRVKSVVRIRPTGLRRWSSCRCQCPGAPRAVCARAGRGPDDFPESPKGCPCQAMPSLSTGADV